jgi:ABC-type Fe3+/spermidine/putrescine transport system ATPase subunit
LYDIGETRLNVTAENGTGRLPAGTPVTLAIRPEDVMLEHDLSMSNRLETRVDEMEYRGSLFRIDLKRQVAGGKSFTITADVPSETVRRLGITPRSTLPIHLPVDRLRVYAAEKISPPGS